jgi:high-affinity Fe2+/Pb2+ permease
VNDCQDLSKLKIICFYRVVFKLVHDVLKLQEAGVYGSLNLLLITTFASKNQFQIKPKPAILPSGG